MPRTKTNRERKVEEACDPSILILTLPFNGNYGGILQGYALSRVVKSISHNSKIVDIQGDLLSLNGFQTFFRCLIRKLQTLCGMTWERRSISHLLELKFAADFWRLISSKTSPLIDFQKVKKYQESRWIVGSDQIWRGGYAKHSGGLALFFLDFVHDETRRRSIAYAASFGTDQWEGTPEELETCGRLLKHFKAISVREYSGIVLCKNLFGIDAVQMPDPTLLLNVKDYEEIIRMKRTKSHKGAFIAAYLLDETQEKLDALSHISSDLDLPIQHLTSRFTSKTLHTLLSMRVPQWLKYLQEASYVITDSFHGCVFSIIFNRPFLCFGNAGRGNTRFDTLLSTFHLESRLLSEGVSATTRLIEPIDWEEVNRIHQNEQFRGIAFLRENLSTIR